MATTVNEIYLFLDQSYPFETQMSFDNAGFLVGDGETEVGNILVALDITSSVIEEAMEKKCQLIITHHPVIFNPLKTLVSHKPTENMIIKLIQNNLSVISAHTNLDRSQEGVNFHLARILQLQNSSLLLSEGTDRNGKEFGLGFKGMVHNENLSLTEYAKFVSDSLDCQGMRFFDAQKVVSKVAVGGGSCGSMLADVEKQGCDTFITGDVKYDIFLEAEERQINLIDAGHYPTEQVICPILVDKIQSHFPSLHVMLSISHRERSRTL